MEWVEQHRREVFTNLLLILVIKEVTILIKPSQSKFGNNMSNSQAQYINRGPNPAVLLKECIIQLTLSFLHLFGYVIILLQQFY